jgi:O-antigen/teichoic acid export membrane protein
VSFYSSFIKKSVFYSFLQILPALAGIIVLKIYSSLLSKEEFAVLAMLTTASTLSFIINSLCLDQVITRYYYDHIHDRKKLNDFFISVISVIFVLLLVLLACVLLIPGSINNYLFKGLLMDYRLQFGAAVLVGFSLSLNKSILSFYRNEQSHRKVLFITFTSSLLQVLLVWIGLKYMGNKVLGAQLGKFAGIFIPTIIFIATYFYGKKARIRIGLIREIVPFFLPLVLYSLMYWGVSQFDQIIFQMRLKNLELLAFYVMAFNIALFADLVINGLSSFMVPEMNLVMKTNADKGRIANYIHLFVLIGCFALLFISLAGELLIDFFLDKKYTGIGWLINGLLIGYIFRMLYSVFSFPVYYFKRTMILALTLSFSLLLSVSFNWFLIPVFGMFALILSNVLSRVSQAWLTANQAGKIYKLPFNRWKIYGLSVIFSLLFLVLMLVDYYEIFNYYLVFIVLSILAAVCSLVLFRKQMPMLINTLKDRLNRVHAESQ